IAEVVREYGPFPGVDHVHGVTYDGRHVWFAAGDTLNAFDPASGKTVRSIDVAAHAGTAFDGRHLFQLAEDRIQKIDPESGRYRSPRSSVSMDPFLASTTSMASHMTVVTCGLPPETH